MMTGSHIVVDIFCVRCGSIVGWKYVRSLVCKTNHSFYNLFARLAPDSSNHRVLCSGNCSRKESKVQGRQICS